MKHNQLSMTEKMFKSHCNTCGRETNHDVLHNETRSRTEKVDEDTAIDWGSHYKMVCCAGCDTVSLRMDSWFSEACDENGQPEIETQYYPPKIFRPKPAWLSDTEHSPNCCSAVRELLVEVYVSLQNNCPRAAAMAVRALLEHLFISTCGDKGTFGNNLNAFQEAGHISPTQRDFLLTVLDAGHATIHRGFKPSRQELAIIVDIAENLVELLYIQKDGVEQLKKRIPPRKNG